jgi:hypothetical protein
MAVRRAETDDRLTFLLELQESNEPVGPIDQFNLAPEEAQRLLQAWVGDAAFMMQQPCYIRPNATLASPGAPRFVNVAAWESVDSLGDVDDIALRVVQPNEFIEGRPRTRNSGDSRIAARRCGVSHWRWLNSRAPLGVRWTPADTKPHAFDARISYTEPSLNHRVTGPPRVSQPW